PFRAGEPARERMVGIALHERGAPVVVDVDEQPAERRADAAEGHVSPAHAPVPESFAARITHNVDSLVWSSSTSPAKWPWSRDRATASGGRSPSAWPSTARAS